MGVDPPYARRPSPPALGFRDLDWSASGQPARLGHSDRIDGLGGGGLDGRAFHQGHDPMTDMRTPRRRAHGLGAAGSGSMHFRSEEHTSELQSLMRISYAVFCLQKKKDLSAQELTNSSAHTTRHHTATK